jgi:mono/diheme cytochrome c family protein
MTARQRRILAWTLVAGKLAFLSIVVASAQTAPALPEGAGRELAERTCSQCHSLELVLRHRMTRHQWEAQLDTMIAKGAKIADEDFEPLADYLSNYLGPSGMK